MTETLPSAPPGDAIFSALWKRHAARFDARRTSSMAIISAHGDIDGTNASAFTDYALANSVRGRGLVLDLSRVEFFGTEGFSALHRVSVRCAHAGIGWALVSGPAVTRLLRICDPHASLPAVDTLGAAMASLQDQPHRPLRLIANAERP
jgi:anti-anti-sigma factor